MSVGTDGLDSVWKQGANVTTSIRSIGMSVVPMHHTSASLVTVADSEGGCDVSEVIILDLCQNLCLLAGIAPLHQVLALFVAPVGHDDPVMSAAQVHLLLPHPVALVHGLSFAVPPFVVQRPQSPAVEQLCLDGCVGVKASPHKFTFIITFHVCVLMFKLLLSFFFALSQTSFFCPALSSLFFPQVRYHMEEEGLCVLCGFCLLSLV